MLGRMPIVGAVQEQGPMTDRLHQSHAIDMLALMPPREDMRETS